MKTLAARAFPVQVETKMRSHHLFAPHERIKTCFNLIRKCSNSLTLLLFCGCLHAQDLLSGGPNSWLLHTPDDGRSSLYFLSGTNGEDWGSTVMTLQNDGRVAVGKAIASYTLDVLGDIGFSGHLFKYLPSLGEGNPMLLSAQSEHGAGEIPIITLGHEQGAAGGTDMDTKIWSYARNPEESRSYLTIGRNRMDLVAPAVYIASKVGIGHGASAELDIAVQTGRIQFTNTRSALVDASDNGGAIYFGVDIAGTDGVIGPTAAIETSWGASFNPQISIGVIRGQSRRSSVLFDFMGNAIFYAYNEERMRLNGHGNFGIGTTNITHKLTVNGAIRAKEVVVDTGWADDVFAPSYKLTSLDEVKEHISKKGRLPGVPSAAEVATNGVSIGESQAILLRKIEELTLHAISQQEQIARQNEEIRGLREEMQSFRTGPK